MCRSLRASSIVIVAVLSGCAASTPQGITTAPGTALQTDLPLGKIRNDVDNPVAERFALDDFCGNLVQLTADGYQPLGIAAYPAGQPPAILTPSATTPDYHALIDSGGAGNLTAAIGTVSGSLNVQGEDRLEVTVSTDSFCAAKNVKKADIANAVAELGGLNIDPANVYFVSFASHTQMTIDRLKSISADTKNAATPIVNIGGQVYSKDDTTKVMHFISIEAEPILAANSARVGSTVPSVAVPMPVPGASHIGAMMALPPEIPIAHVLPRKTLQVGEFQALLRAAQSNTAIEVQ